jgi:3-oxoacyl-[acyl-carrier-protein] synthase III
VLFGDGAGAILLEPAESGYGILDFHHRVDGSGRYDLQMPAGGSLLPPSIATVTARQHFLKQNGKVVFKFAVSQMVGCVQVLLERHGLTPSDVALVVPHQANQRILDAVGERLGVPQARVASVLSCYGNTTGATLPLALHAAVEAGKVQRDDLVVFAAVGAGFTAGATLVRWA